MTPSKALLGSLLVLLAPPPHLEAAQETPRQRLAGQFDRVAASLVQTEELSVQALDISILLATEAAELDPAPDRWRTLLKLASLGERADPRSEALRQLVAIDRQDEVARLLYISDAMERYQTAEERIEKYQLLLAPKNREALGPAVTSRLSNDLALLLDRRGDVDGFSRWLAEAVAVDPSNRSAAATAAGFFRANVADPFAEAELLTTLVMADPTSPEALVLLAELLLEHGAYAGADRLYRLAARSQEALQQFPPEGMLADWALAQWGGGETDGALDIIQRHQRRRDEAYRLELRLENPTMPSLELARLHAPLSSTLATVRAAIHDRLGDQQAASALAAALEAYDVEIGQLEEAEDGDPAELARRHLQAASVALWLGAEIEAAAGHLDAGADLAGDEGLSPEAETRFEGWMALRQHDPDRAVELLGRVSDRDAAARLGLALARREVGELREAARDLYAVCTNRPGTLMAVWASDVLAEVLGQRVGPSPLAARMETLIASIPSVVNRFPDDPSLAVSLRLMPAKTTFGPYEPIIVNIEITNNAPMPLAIDRGGPIQPQVAIFCSIQMARELALPEVPPIIVDIDRRLRLEPREQLIIPVDLRRSSLASVLNERPLRGATLAAVGILGFRLTDASVFVPGVLGSEVSTPPIRVDGIRVSREWIAGAMETALESDTAQNLTTIALLSRVVSLMKRARAADPLGALEEFGDRQLENDAAAAVVEAYTRADAVSRAWLLAVMPRHSVALAPVYTMAQKDEDRHVRMMYLLYCLTSPNDPMIDAARRGSDPDVRAVADLMHEVLRPAGAAP
ncbi:MAG: hypothetical protein ACYSUR_11065 [Planctomycetota bacterium]|jgi:hypothetical protein